jgi:pimeloyl-ACP methyl ester carboxylesterase
MVKKNTMPAVSAYRDRQSRFISIDGMSIHYKREGKGPSIVLLHGSGSSLHCFDALVEDLKDKFELVRPDLPGYGITGPRKDRDYRIETYVSFVTKFVAALKINRFCLGGNSLGGNIAWNVALQHPELLTNLILMNATGYPEKSLPLAMRLARAPFGPFLIKRMLSRRATERNLRQLAGSGTPDLDEKLIDRVHAFISSPGNLQAFIDFSRTDQVDRSLEIPSIKVPTLILRGDSVDGQHFARDIAGCREVIFSGAGRLLPDEIPHEIAKAILHELRTP